MIDSTCVVDKVSSHWVRMGFLFFSVPIAYPYDNFSLMVCSIIVSFIFLSDLPMCLIKTSIFCFVSSYFPWLWTISSSSLFHLEQRPSSRRMFSWYIEGKVRTYTTLYHDHLHDVKGSARECGLASIASSSVMSTQGEIKGR